MGSLNLLEPSGPLPGLSDLSLIFFCIERSRLKWILFIGATIFGKLRTIHSVWFRNWRMYTDFYYRRGILILVNAVPLWQESWRPKIGYLGTVASTRGFFWGVGGFGRLSHDVINVPVLTEAEWETFVIGISSTTNPSKPNDPYRGRTAPLTSKRRILYIYSTNIGTEYLKKKYVLSFFFSSKCSLFHNSKVFGSCIIHILYIYSTNIGTEYF